MFFCCIQYLENNIEKHWFNCCDLVHAYFIKEAIVYVSFVQCSIEVLNRRWPRYDYSITFQIFSMLAKLNQ